MSNPNVPWYPLAELQRLIHEGAYYFGTLAARQLIERQLTQEDVLACILEMDAACFCKSGISTHPLHIGETWDAYKHELYGRRMWIELTIDARVVKVKVISVHPTK